ncbi:hypothetical protein [Endozoicomonas sp. ONNA2]|uniref:hypothetical protein n=1 Tax=Endozoicomonas sp. ONNA2 TaxID=2828741 RepID=UPI002148E306|nr:hypothetical protein [Endozoicomonas sp. ONNA2]
MVGAGIGYLVGKGLDYTAKAAFSRAGMAAERPGLPTTVSGRPAREHRLVVIPTPPSEFDSEQAILDRWARRDVE